MPENIFRLSLMDWKNDEAAEDRRDLSGSSRLTDDERGAWLSSGRPGPRDPDSAAIESSRSPAAVPPVATGKTRNIYVCMYESISNALN